MASLDAIHPATTTNLAAWLNSLLAPSHHPDTEALQQTPAHSLADTSNTLRTLTTHLSSHRQAAQQHIHQLITTLSTTLPTIAPDITIAARAAHALRAHIDHANHPPAAAAAAAAAVATPAATGHGVDDALDRIRILSRINASLTAARNALREAQAWSTLEAHVTSSLAEQRYDEAVDRLTKARHSLSLLGPRTSPSAPSTHNGGGDRETLLDRLTQAIQAHLLPLLASAITARDVDATISTASLLIRLGCRDDGFAETYFTTRRGDVVRSWSQRNTATAGAVAADVSALSKLNSLYGEVLGLLGEERMIAQRIFLDRRQVAELLLASLFANLDPPLHAFLDRFQAPNDIDETLANITKAYQATESACQSIADMLPPAHVDGNGEAADGDVDASPPPPVDRLAVERIPSVSNAQPWRDAMLSPFVPWQADFADLEARAMAARLQASQASSSSVTDRAGRLRSLITSAVESAGASLRRSRALTRGYATTSVMDAIDELLSSLLEAEKRALVEHGQTVVDRIASRGRDRIHAASASASASTGPSGAAAYNDGDDDLTPHDWEDFQRGVDVLASCRGVQAQLVSLETSIAKQLIEVRASLPSHSFDELEKKALLSSSRGDDPTPLDRSTLNSRALRQRIDAASRFLVSPSASPSISPSQQQGIRRTSLLPSSHSRLHLLATTTQKYLHDLLLSPFSAVLSSYPFLGVWSAARHPSASNEYDLTMPTFSLSPSEAVSRIGEGLLNLPRLVEVYAQEEWLAFPPSPPSSLSSGTSGADAGDEGGETTDSTRTPASTAAEHRRLHRQAFSTTTLPDASSLLGPSSSSTTTPAGPGATDSGPTPTTAEAGREEGKETTLSHFLSSLLSSLLSHLFSAVIPSLPRLSDVGTQQLAADLDYLANICAALNDARSEERLAVWRRACLEVVVEGRVKTGRGQSAEGKEGHGEEVGKGGESGHPELQAERRRADEVLARLRGRAA